jgi:hypothetical protein
MSLVPSPGEQEAQNRARQLSEPKGWVGHELLIGSADMYGISLLADCDLVCGDGAA